MQSAFIATCPNSNEAAIVVLGVTTVSEFRAAAAAQGLIRTCDDEEGYEFYKPLQAWAVLTPEGTWDLGASSDAPDALPAMVATARWVSITSCQCEACPVNEGTHKPAGALLQIDEPKSSVNQVDEAINSLLRAALIEGGCSAERVIEAREETNLRRAELRTLLSTPRTCSRSHPHEEMTPMCELRTEIARLTNALARAEAQLAAAQQGVQHVPWCPDVCPLTGRKFFMWIEHWATGKDVPTYGGPYDSYTIPVKEQDGTFTCERYDHDAGEWMTKGMGWECVGVMLVDDQSFVVDPKNPRYMEIKEFATHPTQQGMDAQIIHALSAGMSIEQWQSSVDVRIGSSDLLGRAIASGEETRIELVRHAVSEVFAAQAKQGGA